MSCYFEEALIDFAPAAVEQARQGFQIIGTSGTITTVAASHLGLKRYDRTKVDGLEMNSDQIDTVARTYADAMKHPVPTDTRAWSQIIVSMVSDIPGIERKKGPDLADGSERSVLAGVPTAERQSRAPEFAGGSEWWSCPRTRR